MQEGRKSVCDRIAERMRKEIELGIIADGEKLPSCRELAHTLGVNPNTVQKAYTILERMGYIDVVPQKGAYAHKAPLNRVDAGVTEHAEMYIRALKKQGLPLVQLKAIADRIYGEDQDD